MDSQTPPAVTDRTGSARADLLRHLMRRHFDPGSGSAFWLAIRDELDFDPVRDIRSWRDLRRFRPYTTRALAARPADLVATGSRDGRPPRPVRADGAGGGRNTVLLSAAWLDVIVDWRVARYAGAPGRTVGDTLLLLPGELEFAHEVSSARAQRLGSGAVSVDVDQRRPEELAGAFREVERLTGERKVAYLATTVPVLDLLLDDEAVTRTLRNGVRHVTLYDAHRDPPATARLRDRLPEPVEMSAILSCAPVLAEFRTGLIQRGEEPLRFEGIAPFVGCELLDDSGDAVERAGIPGVLSVTHVSEGLFLPGVDLPLRARYVDEDRIAGEGAPRFEIDCGA